MTNTGISPKELIYNTDFKLEYDEKYKKMIVFILKPSEYSGISININKISVVKMEEDDLQLDLDYTFVDLPKKHKKKALESDKEFESYVGDIIYTILCMNEKEDDNNESEILDETEGSKSGNLDIGEPI